MRQSETDMRTKSGFELNPHAKHPISLWSMIAGYYNNRQLISQMVRREVIGRYKGSVLGLAWSFFNPLFMLAAYTFAFSVVFKARWGGLGGEESKTQFALVLFVGMIMHGLLSEVLNRAPGLILSNTNYVKKVVFPLDILPFVNMTAAMFHTLVSLVVLLIAFIISNGYIPWTAIFIPLVILPLAILTLGCGLFLASLGVYIRDMEQVTGVVTTVMMFLSPVFYPITAVPEQFRPWIMSNPLTFIIIQAREVLIWGNLPDWEGLAIYTIAAGFIAWLSYVWFQRTRKGFADVL